MSEENKTVELKEEELKKVTGGAYDPNTGKGLVVGDCLCNNVYPQMYYKITNINSIYYNVKSFVKNGSTPVAVAVLMQITFNAIVRGDYIPCEDPGDLVDINEASYPAV